MKLEIIKDKLSEIITVAEKITGKNLTLPILNSILLTAKKNSLIIKATNLDVGLEVEIPIKVIEDGEAAINAVTLSSFLNNLPKEEKIIIKSVNNNIHIATNFSSTLIKCFPVEDFPVIPRVSSHPFILRVKDLLKGFKSVLSAASLSDIKPEIASVYIYQDNQDLVFVATDSFRLAEQRITIEDKSKEFQSVIIPFKNVSEIIRVLENAPGEVRIESSKNQISFFTNDVHFTSRVIDGNFPDYKQIMPTKFKTTITVSKDGLSSALKLANIFTDKFNQINLKVNPKDNLFEINSQNQEVGENNISLKADLSGEKMEVVFNARYLLDGFLSINSPMVILQFSDKNKPLLVKGADNDTFSYILMPINR
ncbi:MAG: DNA polymerase III subunit beta [Patescibacteria group bacterium]